MKKMLMFLLLVSLTFFISCGEDDDVKCQNACEESKSGATQCTTDKKDFEACTLQDNGCYEWIETDCTGDEVCVVAPATSIAACGVGEVNEATVCTNGGNECVGNTNGKTECTNDLCTEPVSTGCTGDADCSGSTPVCNASGECVADTTSPEPCATDGCDESGTTECDTVDSDVLKTCTLQAEGCLKWEETDCADNSLTCSDTTGTPACGMSIK